MFFLGVLLYPFVLLTTLLDKRRHFNYPHSTIAKKLERYFGLEKEVRGRYSGLKGNFRGYFLRIYFDPASKGGTTIVLIYYERPLNNFGSIDFIKVENIDNEFKVKIRRPFVGVLKGYNTSFTWIEITRLMQSRSAQIIDCIDKSISQLIEIGLEPVTEEIIEKLIQESSYDHGPIIDTFQDNFKEL